MILAIESTCDETGAAVVRPEDGGVEVISNVVASSAEMHEKYGGIVPEVAAREQVRVIVPVIKEALEKAGVGPEDISAVAVSQGPGLVGSLLVGIETAKALAMVWEKKLLAVNHMAAHVMANWICSGEAEWTPPELPAVGVVVSGGHTDLIWMESLSEWRWLGGTRDDAAGECLDKCARILGLPYPGGPAIERTAQVINPGSKELNNGIRLPRPMLDQNNYEMSFSGIKSALDSLVKELKGKEENFEALIPYLAREVLEAVVEVLVAKTMRAVEELAPKSVLLAGGVAASTPLRQRLSNELQKVGVGLFVPEIRYCTDNAAMIGAAAVLRPEEAQRLELRPEPGMEVV